jgi:RNA polymerase sigma-70 factor, ECF subfamily
MVVGPPELLEAALSSVSVETSSDLAQTAMKTNAEWLQALKAGGAEQDDALKDLREILIHGLRAYLSVDRAYNSARGSEAGQIVEDCAQETLLIIKRKIGSFRGESRFTTWATTIAIRQLLGQLRRRKWNELSIDPSSIGRELPNRPVEALPPDTPEIALQQDEVWSLIKRIVEKDLTSKQRFVLIASAFQGMPLDLIADKLGTHRDNVYKMLHDARKKLKRCLMERGLTPEEILRTFEAKNKNFK